LQTAIYVEGKAKNKQIRGNAGGYARTVFEKGARIEVGANAKVQTEAVSTSPTVDKKDTSAEERSRQTTAKIKSLTLSEKQTFAGEYMAEGGKGNTYQPETGTFKNPLERTAYTSWLRAKIAGAPE
jgi:hypothetical protein